MSLNNQNNQPLPPVYRFDFGDYTSLGSSFQKFLSNLNLFTYNTYNILNGGVGYANLAQAVYSFTVTAGTTTSFSFINPLSIAPSAVILGQVVVTSDIPSPITDTVSIANWYFDGKYINILSIPGLTSGTNYKITVIVS